MQWTPCHENWAAMTAVDKGRFCSACEKKVFDFTGSSDRQIALVLKNSDNACGRFTTSQLNRKLVIPREKDSLRLATGAAVMSLFVLGEGRATAQSHAAIEMDQSLGKVQVKDLSSEKILIKGKVSDMDQIPLPGIQVSIKNSTVSVLTDFDGDFSIMVNLNDTLEIIADGMTSQQIVIKNQQNLLITLQSDPEYMEPMFVMGKMIPNPQNMIAGGVTIEMISKERSFFGHIFNSIGNWFR
ncbi:MAG: hypothetical protein EOO20_21950 [Chryseobacterium sp.]|nr:MAG: hypothetical protein EOO20_21950 [Chryseobacterium sp.]